MVIESVNFILISWPWQFFNATHKMILSNSVNFKIKFAQKQSTETGANNILIPELKCHLTFLFHIWFCIRIIATNGLIYAT